MAKIKEGADVTNLHPRIQDAITKADKIYKEFGIECVITSGRDSKHGTQSLHYKGQAVDLRLRDFINILVQKLRSACGPDYDIIAEFNPPHIHLEYDPKGRK